MSIKIRVMSFFVLFLILFCSLVSADDYIKWGKKFKDALDKSEKQGKLICVYFYSGSCRYSYTMTTVTLKDKKVIKLHNENFINLKLEKKRYSDLAKIYDVKGTPRIYILDSSGRVLYRIFGLLKPQDYLYRLNKILKNEKEFKKLIKEIKKDSENVAKNYKLAKCSLARNRTGLAKKYFKKVQELAKADEKYKKIRLKIELGILHLLFHREKVDSARKKFKEIIKGRKRSEKATISTELMNIASAVAKFGSYKGAGEAYYILAKNFLTPNSAPGVLYKAGRYYFYGQDRKRAVSIFKEIVNKYPTSKAARYAKEALRKLGH